MDLLEDDDEDFDGLYENGHWVWDDIQNKLSFESDLSMSEDDFTPPTPAAFGSLKFKDDLDIMEQQRFRKHYQRRPKGDDDVIYLQDIKDIVIYTAPNPIITPSVISMLHLSTTDRFIRALIFYFQYYLQIADEMAKRILELETKVRTPRSTQVELEFRENLEDLRLLLAKEYCTMILGGADLKKFHHMGPSKKSKSLSKKDAFNFESVLRISLQIVWLALGQQSFHQIELETHRLFKSQLFNIIDHSQKTDYVNKMASFERFVLLGHCLNEKQKLNMRSPLMNEILCHRAMDFRIFGLGTIEIPVLCPRLRYMEQTLTMSEELFQKNGVVLGILGLTRSRFDTMLRQIKIPVASSASSSSMRMKSVSRASRSSMRKSTIVSTKLVHEINIPPKHYDDEWFPEDFPTKTTNAMPCDRKQRLKWMARAARLADRQVKKKYR